ncbi:hypothetical protein [Bradyrhizobium sp. USDA 10063]
MRYFLLLLTLSAAPASAWTVTHERDRMTDKQLTWASAISGDATLLVGCLNGEVQPRLTWNQRIGWGDVSVTYRFDDGPVNSHFAMVSQDGRALYIWLNTYNEAMAKLRRGKRLRVQLGQAFYDFDLAKGDSIPTIKCG